MFPTIFLFVLDEHGISRGEKEIRNLRSTGRKLHGRRPIVKHTAAIPVVSIPALSHRDAHDEFIFFPAFVFLHVLSNPDVTEN